MRAVLCRSYGPAENLTLESTDDPIPQADELLVAIHAAGLNFPDNLQIQGQYQKQPPFPFIPGSEIAGVVEAVGADVSGFAVGDRVMAQIGNGGLAEKAVADPFLTYRLPDSMPMLEAAGFQMIYGTSYHALKQRANLQAGETLLVLGAAGGVGLAAVELGKVMGARVIAAASSEEKLAIAKDAGADELINYHETSLKDQVKALTDGKGADVIYDPVGGELFDQCTRCINWKGRILVVGFASGTIPRYPTNLALLKGCQLVGVFWGNFRDNEPDENRRNFDELFQFYTEGKIKPLISQQFALDQWVAAMTVLRERRAVGKVVIAVR